MQNEPAERSMTTKLYSWRIYRVLGDLHPLGIVDAIDSDHAVKVAIQKFEITNPEHQKRLLAQRRV